MSDVADARLRRACQETYRAAWLAFYELLQLAPGISADLMTAKGRMQKLMDSVQPFCCADGRPCAEWDAFKATLPGYNEFWAGAQRIIADVMSKMKLDFDGKPIDPNTPKAG